MECLSDESNLLIFLLSNSHHYNSSLPMYRPIKNHDLFPQVLFRDAQQQKKLLITFYKNQMLPESLSHRYLSEIILDNHPTAGRFNTRVTWGSCCTKKWLYKQMRIVLSVRSEVKNNMNGLSVLQIAQSPVWCFVTWCLVP